MVSKRFWIDLETTGLDPKRHAVWQFAMMVEIDGRIVERLKLQIAPFDGARIDDNALEVGGIKEEDLANGIPPREAYLKIIATLDKHIRKWDKKDKGFFCGYNCRFDQDFLHAMFERYGNSYMYSYFWFPSLDVAVIAGNLLQSERWSFKDFKLGTLAKHLNITPEGDLHDAMTDIELTRNVYLSLNLIR